MENLKKVLETGKNRSTSIFGNDVIYYAGVGNPPLVVEGKEIAYYFRGSQIKSMWQNQARLPNELIRCDQSTRTFSTMYIKKINGAENYLMYYVNSQLDLCLG